MLYPLLSSCLAHIYLLPSGSPLVSASAIPRCGVHLTQLFSREIAETFGHSVFIIWDFGVISKIQFQKVPWCVCVCGAWLQHKGKLGARKQETESTKSPQMQCSYTCASIPLQHVFLCLFHFWLIAELQQRVKTEPTLSFYGHNFFPPVRACLSFPNFNAQL